LVAHPADVEVVVDGIAAFAASAVMMAGDTITVNTGASCMVHDAWTWSIGDASDITETAKLLDHVSNNVASAYAEQAGGSVDEWREVMRAETWFSAEEAVEAGLATKVGKKAKKDDNPKSQFDLSIFNYAGRSNAPAPRLDINKAIVFATVRSTARRTSSATTRLGSFVASSVPGRRVSLPTAARC